MTALPTAEDLSRAAREAAARCGVDLDAVHAALVAGCGADVVKSS